MMANIWGASPLPVLSEVVGFTHARHDVLAGNLANYGTPGYQVRDLSAETFQERLREAVEARDRKGAPVAGGKAAELDEKLARVRESLKDIRFHDQTNVSLEHQVNEMTKNQLLHSMAVSVMTSQFRLLSTAISERV